jgi:hypothetical protein
MTKKVYVISSSFIEHDVSHFRNLVAVSDEKRAEILCENLERLQEFNEEFYQRQQEYIQSVAETINYPELPEMPEPSEEFRRCQAAVAGGQGTPETKAAFKKAQAEHIKRKENYSKQRLEWKNTYDACNEELEQKRKEWFAENYIVPNELKEASKYLKFDGEWVFSETFGKTFDYHEVELLE